MLHILVALGVALLAWFILFDALWTGAPKIWRALQGLAQRRD